VQPRTLRGIFINPAKANCSIYESGRMIYESLILSEKYELDYLEVDENKRNILNNYDFYAFNYHCVTMRWFDTRWVRRLRGLKITFVLEVAPNDPFVLCPAKDFDVYCALDPSMNVADKRVYAFPRPLEAPINVMLYQDPLVPVIGSFGFATPGKGFELVVDAVNKEFDQAIVRINIPLGTYADDICWGLHQQNYADYLTDLCKKTAKKGVQVVVTRDYMSKEELIAWCGQNTLNCFLYSRKQAGLAATTDQAISSGRPLAVSDNDTFRHITAYIKAYPFRTLKESIEVSQPEVLRLQKEWTPRHFAARFEQVLQDFNLTASSWEVPATGQMVELQKKSAIHNLISRATSKTGKLAEKFGLLSKEEPTCQNNQSVMETDSTRAQKKIVLIVSHKEKQCGIYQYGINIYEALKKSTRYSFRYAECSNREELSRALLDTGPTAIIYNYYPKTMPWLNSSITHLNSVPQLGIMHEVTQEGADRASAELFDYHLCPDPTLCEHNPLVFKTKRLIPSYLNRINIPDTVTIGSFGFGFGDKGFERVVETVQREFDQAKILLRLPFNDIVDKKGKNYALATAGRCRRLICKPGIELIINHDFVSKQQLLDFLAGNTINAFFYDTEKHEGISSTIEHALAVQRPLAITKCGMFRHVLSATPTISIEDSSLQQIIKNGIVPLVPFYNEWSEASFVMDYERILDIVLSRQPRKS
jgi:hypothetical protein